MIFRITRASRWTNEKAPIEEAKMIDAKLEDERKFTLEEAEWLGKTDYLERGHGHENIKGGSHRFLDKKIWVVEIDGLDEMMSLFDKYGALVLTESDYLVNGKQLNEIIIYDDYIE